MRAHFASAGWDRPHGTHEYRRHGGSIGTNMTPGRTLPNLKMPGQYGNETVSVLNLRVARIDAEKGLLLLEGGIPGSKNALVVAGYTVLRFTWLDLVQRPDLLRSLILHWLRHPSLSYLFSGLFPRFPHLRVAYSEGQIGWLPYVLERADDVWATHEG